nr:neurexin-2-like [Oncorhynchus nerka]
MTSGLRFSALPMGPLVFLSLLVTARALEFGGAPGQWARYGRWEAGSLGELSFSLKTNISKALLLYLDDGGNCDFMELLIAGGRLQLRFAIHCAEPATLHMETQVNDDRWHMVLLTRNFRETLLMVDGETKMAEVKSKRKEMAVVSDLFVGGIPPDVRLSALTSSTVKYEPPFLGLISNLKVGETPPTLLNSQGIQSDMEYLCTKQNPCLNGGFCSIQYGEVHCDCTHTRYKGKYCKEGSPPTPSTPTSSVGERPQRDYHSRGPTGVDGRPLPATTASQNRNKRAEAQQESHGGPG